MNVKKIYKKNYKVLKNFEKKFGGNKKFTKKFSRNSGKNFKISKKGVPDLGAGASYIPQILDLL